ncbi:Imm49 family immunity protein [Nocardiopsis changdeensis]|uniref:Immunity 49 family protein n=1 Tax=Nocardiopsis changdeensis TaxID=2831969 RepID=A0ABX8BMT6_9ACTN|nr:MULTISPECIES: Imm49 family immunity protein [Nocardiopsis]QUX22619.1 immunity 49 family protein [Nocardiopsis changdeensis]QYX38561.1 immunity 49 family protein [Nocardiopsis sp. MT53]
MQQHTRHGVDDGYLKRIVNPAELRERVSLQFHALRHLSSRVSVLQEMSRTLLDHLGARSVDDPDLSGDPAHFGLVLRTAAESADGVLECLMAPEGDQRIPLSWLGGELTNMNEDHDDLDPPFRPVVDMDLTPQVWVEAVELAVVGRRVRDQGRASGAGYRMYASILHDLAGQEVFPAADVAQMDALGMYLNPAGFPLPRDWPKVALCMPSEAERATAARALDSAGELSGEQSLLRVLLQDDQELFEQELEEYLDRYRRDMDAVQDPAPRTLLPMGVIALVALAVQVHGWRVDLSSDYLPEVLVRAPEGVPPVERPAPPAG